MTAYVVDANTAVKWAIPEVHTAEARRLLHQGNSLKAPDLFATELANIMVKKVRAGTITALEAPLFLSQITRPVRILDARHLLARAIDVALRHGRSAYDSLYVALALQEGARFVTADLRLFHALAPHYPDTMLWIEDIPV